jgi:hypothetical protein
LQLVVTQRHQHEVDFERHHNPAPQQDRE